MAMVLRKRFMVLDWWNCLIDRNLNDIHVRVCKIKKKIGIVEDIPFRTGYDGANWISIKCSIDVDGRKKCPKLIITDVNQSQNSWFTITLRCIVPPRLVFQ